MSFGVTYTPKVTVNALQRFAQSVCILRGHAVPQTVCMMGLIRSMIVFVLLISITLVHAQSPTPCVFYNSRSSYLDLNWAAGLGESGGDYYVFSQVKPQVSLSIYWAACGPLRQHDELDSGSPSATLAVIYNGITYRESGLNLSSSSSGQIQWNANLKGSGILTSITISITCNQTGQSSFQPQLSSPAISGGGRVTVNFATRCFGINRQIIPVNTNQLLNVTLNAPSQSTSSLVDTVNGFNFSCITTPISNTNIVSLSCPCTYTTSGQYVLSVMSGNTTYLSFYVYVPDASSSLVLPPTLNLFSLRLLGLRAPPLNIFLSTPSLSCSRGPNIQLNSGHSVIGLLPSTSTSEPLFAFSAPSHLSDCIFVYTAPSNGDIVISNFNFSLGGVSVVNVANSLSVYNTNFYGNGNTAISAKSVTNYLIIYNSTLSNIGTIQLGSIGNITAFNVNFIQITGSGNSGCFFGATSSHLNLSNCNFDGTKCRISPLFSLSPNEGTFYLVGSSVSNFNSSVLNTMSSVNATVQVNQTTFDNNSVFTDVSFTRMVVTPILVNGGTLYISNGTFSNNQAVSGYTSGVDITDATVSIFDAKFTNNHGKASGSPIYIEEKNAETIVNITNLSCTGNAAQFGGCLNIYGFCDVAIQGAIIVNNSASALGGAMNFQTINSFRMDSFVVRNNSSPIAAGAMYVATSSGDIILSNGNISDNGGSFNGGAILLGQSNTLDTFSMQNVRVTHNSAATGAGISNSGQVSDFTLTDCVISNNVGSDGLGFFSNGILDSITLDNVTVSDHVASGSGAGMQISGQIDTFVVMNSRMYNNSVGTTGGSIYLAVSGGSDISFQNSTFYGSSAAYGSAVYINSLSADVAFQGEAYDTYGSADESGSRFYNNTVTVDGAAIWVSQFNTLVVEDLDCHDNSASNNGGCMSSSSINGSIAVSNSRFTRNKSNKGAAVYSSLNAANLSLFASQGNEWTSNTAAIGGTVELSGNIDFTSINDTMTSNRNQGVLSVASSSYSYSLDVYNLTATENQGVFYLLGSAAEAIIIRDSLFSGNRINSISGSVLYVAPSAGSRGLNVSGCTVDDNGGSDNFSGYGGAFYVHADNGGVNIDGSSFTNNMAFEGGAVYITRDTTLSRQAFTNNLITSSEFSSNVARTGGALSLYGSTDFTSVQLDNTGNDGATSVNLGSGDFTVSGSNFTGGASVFIPSDSTSLLVYNSPSISISCPSSLVSNFADGGDSALGGPPNSSGLSTTAKAGIIAGCIVLVVVVVILVVLLIMRRKRMRRKEMMLEMQRLNVTDLILTDVKVQHIIGHGNFGNVYKGNWNETEVALKSLKEEGSTDSHWKEEIVLLKKLNHPNVVNLLGVYLHEDNYLMVLEYVSNGSLDNFLRKYNHELEDEGLISMCYDIVKGMMYLQSKGVIHRDLSARNVLVDASGQAKISDFGMSREHSHYEAKSKVMPIRWSAPESIQFKLSTFESDVWSFGVLAWEIFSLGQVPYFELTANQDVIKYVINDRKILSKPERCPEDIYNVLVKCWSYEPSDRPNFKQLHTMMSGLYSPEKISRTSTRNSQQRRTGVFQAGDAAGASVYHDTDKRATEERETIAVITEDIQRLICLSEGPGRKSSQYGTPIPITMKKVRREAKLGGHQVSMGAGCSSEQTVAVENTRPSTTDRFIHAEWGDLPPSSEEAFEDESSLPARAGFSVGDIGQNLSSSQKRMVSTTWAIIEDNKERTVEMFYSQLFERRPHMRTMFPNSMALQRKIFIGTLQACVRVLDGTNISVDDFGAVRRRHRRLKLVQDDLEAFGLAFLWTLENILGLWWNDDVRDAWFHLFNAIIYLLFPTFVMPPSPTTEVRDSSCV
ncbi:tyrosine-protein kinase Fer-like isoform 2 [Planoprotostelium fungivorum]|uniref:Tyrosine-protein kinase Fer-like isoform 2 n=1 Tax=Planoprotostelium fungivorum TaxID=1890364 RepID=A0A2P6NVZ6_9EUKA|nr:tyrosine-protein kinase Fer-like isoform 2 [Planoprotostelium fungivorum]